MSGAGNEMLLASVEKMMCVWVCVIPQLRSFTSSIPFIKKQSNIAELFLLRVYICEVNFNLLFTIRSSQSRWRWNEKSIFVFSYLKLIDYTHMGKCQSIGMS